MNREQTVGLAAIALLLLGVGQGISAARAQTSPLSPTPQGGVQGSTAPTSLLLAAPSPPAASPSPAAPLPSLPPDASTGLGRRVTLTPTEQLSKSDTFLSVMDNARNSVRHQLETARAQHDVVKTLCLNDKLTQIDVSIRTARERRRSLELAVKMRDADLSGHEFTILTVLSQRCDQLTKEANQCIGQEAGFIGETAVTSTIDPNLPKEDPSVFPGPNAVIDPPACSSCFQ